MNDSTVSDRWWPFKLWPVLVCWVLMMVCTVVGALAFEYSQSATVETVVQGLFLGEFALAAIVGGLVGRTWIVGWLVSVFLVIFATLLCCGVDAYTAWYLSFYDDGFSRLALCSFWPLLMLASCAPMIAMRGLRGWSLTLGESTSIAKHPSSLEDLFLLSVIVASCISLARLIEEVTPGLAAPQLFLIAGFFGGFSLLFVVPSVALTFRLRSWPLRLAGWSGMAVAAMSACLILTWTMNESFNFRQEFSYVVIGTCAAACTMIVGGLSMLFSGVKLTHFDRSPNNKESEFTDIDASDPIASLHRPKFQGRLLTGLVAIVAIANVSALNFAQFRRLAFFRDIQTYDERFPGQVTELTIRDDEVVGVTFAPTSTDDALDRYRNSHNVLERLSLSHSEITDAAIDKLSYFPKLKHLDLSHTAITNIGLEKLSSIGSLSTLSLANTSVDLDTALRIARQLGVTDLDVSGIGVTDDDLNSDLVLDPSLALRLSHNPITDIGVANLLKNTNRLRNLDLSDTSIDGSGLVSVKCPSSLVLDRTAVTDATLTQILNAGSRNGVSIKETAITAAVLPLLAVKNLRLTLGDGKIGEQDLENLPAGAYFQHLALNSKKFTGDFLQWGKIRFQTLDLSHSGVTDEALSKFSVVQYVYYINLSYTDITDKGLAVVSCQEVDVRHTKVTAPGLLEFLQFGKIYIDHNQFTPEELVSLRNSKVVVDGEYGR